MVQVFLALGSNVDDRLRNLREATAAIGRAFDCLRSSRIYETDAMYREDQPAFLNAVVEITTSEGPLELLRTAKRIEAAIGPRSGERYGPRRIDIDIVAYGSLRLRSRIRGETTLEIPHSRLTERRFVLEPFADLAPEFVLPGLGRVRDLLGATKDSRFRVQPLSDALLPL
ncbi:MAG: 2-amino-4-hydroxy-6-hydroxymethyldihydropteridine diphosphokinase [Fimbriimonadaceae bacterium]|nr:2-amino-4-hydroxy-6-hydroxymethyldihydropteridine diphosphokinase [Fimbriimonadaceae bacterium]NUM38214.1 2-amino-4-hydroxy-6-hydroxymethyldihydropteridine diphosphokinase [Armatimonadota bacterium]